jgi:hypothetical protein
MLFGCLYVVGGDDEFDTNCFVDEISNSFVPGQELPTTTVSVLFLNGKYISKNCF